MFQPPRGWSGSIAPVWWFTFLIFIFSQTSKLKWNYTVMVHESVIRCTHWSVVCLMVTSLPAVVVIKISNMASGQFRKYIWDPVLIISQILAMQSVFYFFVGLWLAIIDHVTGSLTSLDQIFNYKVCVKFLRNLHRFSVIIFKLVSHRLCISAWIFQELEFSSYNGRLILVAFVLNSLTGWV